MVTVSPLEFPDMLLDHVVLGRCDSFDEDDVEYGGVFHDDDDTDDSVDEYSMAGVGGGGGGSSDPEWLALVLGDSAELVGEAVDILFNARDRRLSVDIMELQKVMVESKVVTPRQSIILQPQSTSTACKPAVASVQAAAPCASSVTALATTGAVVIKSEEPTVCPAVPSATQQPMTPVKIEAAAASAAVPPSPAPSSKDVVPSSSTTASLMMPVYQPRPVVPPSSCVFKTPVIPNDGKKRIGAYTVEERRMRIQKYLAKKSRRIWRKKIKYDCRKKLADNRPRIKGRFVKREEEEELEEHGAALQDDESLMTGLLTFEELLG